MPSQRRITGISVGLRRADREQSAAHPDFGGDARALYREWFVQFRFPSHEKLPRVASPIGEIPKGWEVKPLESLMTDHIGGGWGKEVADEYHTEPAWVATWYPHASIEDESRWDEYLDWLTQRLVKMDQVLRPIVKALP